MLRRLVQSRFFHQRMDAMLARMEMYLLEEVYPRQEKPALEAIEARCGQIGES